AATGAPILFIGTGEKTEDIELFDPPRFVGRLLGMGDIKGIIEKVKDAEVHIPQKKAAAFLTGRFTLTDMFEQLESLRKLGPLGKVLKMVPGLGPNLPESALEMTEERMKMWKAMLQSMTPEERDNPKILSSSRMRRIARGSGTSEKNVKELLQQYEMAKKMMKTLMRRRHPFKSFGAKVLGEDA
ncbi:MAG: signal recognition particle protein Srp19, partial [Candidatus Bathyarchaeia archaeon]